MSVVVISRGGLTGTLSTMNISLWKIELTHVHAIIGFKLIAILILNLKVLNWLYLFK